MMCRYNYYCILWILCNRCPMTDHAGDSPIANVYWRRWCRVAVCDYRDQCLFGSTMMMGLMLRRRWYVYYLLQIGCCWRYPTMLMNHLRSDETKCPIDLIDDSQYHRHQCYCRNWSGVQSLFFGTMCPATTTNMHYFLLSDMMRSAYYFQCLVSWMRLLGRYNATWVALIRFESGENNFVIYFCRH